MTTISIATPTTKNENEPRPVPQPAIGHASARCVASLNQQPPAAHNSGLTHTEAAAAAFEVLCRDVARGHECECFNCGEARVVVMPDTVHRLTADGMVYFCSQRCADVHAADLVAMQEWKATTQHTPDDPFASQADIEAREEFDAANVQDRFDGGRLS